MADLSNALAKRPGAPPERPGEQPDRDLSLVALVELLFFAYRDFTGDADEILATYQFGRAHHRVLHFVEHYPGLRVADLLLILKITKQSLARVLRQLVAGGFIEQRLGKSDRRERRLYVTPAGHELACQLLAPQIERVRDALGGGHAADLRKIVSGFLSAMIDPQERARVEAILPGAGNITRRNHGAKS